MPTPQQFGQVPGVPVDAHFGSRREIMLAGLHRNTQAGISYSSAGADAIIVSGGYKDDNDLGDVIVYTGHGGQDMRGNQIGDQKLHMGNLALAKSCTNGLPVRVIRGVGGNPKYSPQIGYRYDGLFTVEAFWHQKGADGHEIWRFRLVALAATDSSPDAEELGGSNLMVARFNSVQRLIRNTAVVQAVKVAHEYTCQICRNQLLTFVGPYAEGAHIRPLGEPHRGPDVQDNVLCLCPDCHVQFDYGALVVQDDLRVLNLVIGTQIGLLRTVRQHVVDKAQLAYHRELFASRASMPTEYKPSSLRHLRVAEDHETTTWPET